MSRTVFSALLVTLLLAAPLSAATVSRIAAIVNDEIITTYQLRQELDRQLEAKGLDGLPDGTQGEVLRREVLDRLIEEALMQQRIVELGIKAEDEEVEAAILDVQAQNQLSRSQLEDALLAQGMDFDLYRETLRKQILRFKLLGREVRSQVEVTNQEVRDYFREHIADYRQKPTLRLSRLTFSVAVDAEAVERAETRTQAEAARARILGGESFAAVLRELSAAGKAEGGDMGSFQEGELTPSFDAAVRDLAAGDVAELVETPQGYHLLRVEERTPGSVRQFDVVEDEIRAQLLERKTEGGIKAWMEKLREKAYVDIRL